jgi:autotransporter-associated beta strand protein
MRIWNYAQDYSGPTLVNAARSGRLILCNPLAMQNSAIDTSGGGVIDVSGDASSGSTGKPNTPVPNPTFGGLIGSKNVLSVFNSSYTTLVTNMTLNPGPSVTNSYSGVLADGVAGMTLTVTGSGTQVLSGTNTYSGATIVSGGSGGTLALGSGGSIANTPRIDVQAGNFFDVSALSAFTLSSSQTLMGNGTVIGAVTVNGTVSPGESVGTLNTGSQTWNGGATDLFELSSAVNSSGMDLLNITGTLNVQASSGNKFTVKLVSMADASTPGPVPDFNAYTSYTWVVATASGGIQNFDASKFAIDASAFANPHGGTFSVGVQGSSLVVNYTAPALVPPTLNGFGPLSGGSFPLTFSGPSGQPYKVLSSTNVELPLASWTVLTTGTFGASPETYTDTSATNGTQFYRIQSP